MTKRKASGKCVTRVVFLLDETGSMESCRHETIEGFNKYIASLREDKSTDFRFSLNLFDTEHFEQRYKQVTLDKVKKLNADTYKPGAGTPLYDAIAKSIRSMEEIIQGEPAHVLMVILTDGMENSSVEWTRGKVFDLIKEKEKVGWSFIYLGANQDAWNVGQSLGMSHGNTRTYDTLNIGNVFCGMASATKSYALRSGASSDFTSSKSVLDESNYDEIVNGKKKFNPQN